MSIYVHQRLDTLRTALLAFDHQVQNVPAGSGETAQKKVKKLARTSAQGLPSQYTNQWEWAGAWVKQHGVTLPPDTSEYRSLRNWFCFQVNMFKKGTLSSRSKELLAKYGIDLALYRAPNTGRGQLIDDQKMIHSMRVLYEISGSYDLPSEAEPELVEWQARLLEAYRSRGISARMKEIERQLPGLRYGLWMRPDEMPVPKSQLPWWRMAAEFRHATANYPAFRGVIDRRTPAHLVAWASEQISAAQARNLTSRQRGEMISIGLLATSEHKRCKKMEAALLLERVQKGELSHFGYRERDLNSFLGVLLLVRLLKRNAPVVDVYSTLAITPHQYARLVAALEPFMGRLLELGTRDTISDLRGVYRLHHVDIDQASGKSDLPAEVFDGHGESTAKRLQQFTQIVLQAREAIRAIDVKQDIVKRDLSAMH